MGTPTLRGTPYPVIEQQTLESDPSRGTTVKTEYSGISDFLMTQLANSYIFSGVQVSKTIKNGVSRMSTVDATANTPIDVWELIGDAERKDLFQNPNWGDALGAPGSLFNSQLMASIRWFLASEYPAHGPANVGGAFDPPQANDSIPVYVNDLSGLSGSIIDLAYSRYQSGNDEFENDAYAGGYVLRHTANVPNRWSGNITDSSGVGAGALAMASNVGLIYPATNLLTEVSNNSFWTLPIVVGSWLYTTLFNISAIIPQAQANYFWGWKKSRQTIDTTANNRLNVTQHYILELWSSDDYQIL